MRIPLAALGLFLGCSGARSDGPAEERIAFQAPPSRAGYLRLTEAGLRFVECGRKGEGVAVAAADSYLALVREMGGRERQVPAMVRLTGGRLAAVRFAGPAGQGCEGLPPEGVLEARGNEPFWHARVEDSQVTVRTPEDTAGVVYRDGRWSRPGEGRWSYQAAREENGGTDRLALEITDEVCFDSMSGARYPYTAELAYAGRQVEGCALEGRGATTP